MSENIFERIIHLEQRQERDTEMLDLAASRDRGTYGSDPLGARNAWAHANPDDAQRLAFLMASSEWTTHDERELKSLRHERVCALVVSGMRTWDDSSSDKKRMVAYALADAFAVTNARFDRSRFLDLCAVPHAD
jgi:hypothetical protein